jgi:hypothetical protein
VYRSTGTNGASWNFTGRPVAEHNDVAGAGNFLLDKPLMAVDDGMHSPFRDRVYVTWTTFADDGTAYINEASSADYGEHFSAPVVVSTDSSLCAKPATATHPDGRCDSNQFSDPFQLAVTGNIAHPVWSDTRAADLFLCPGTGTVGNPPQVCTGTGANFSPANDQEIYTASITVH